MDFFRGLDELNGTGWNGAPKEASVGGIFRGQIKSQGRHTQENVPWFDHVISTNRMCVLWFHAAATSTHGPQASRNSEGAAMPPHLWNFMK
jgi:hypothetical protein